jgi:hypothetical protein
MTPVLSSQNGIEPEMALLSLIEWTASYTLPAQVSQSNSSLKNFAKAIATRL